MQYGELGGQRPQGVSTARMDSLDGERQAVLA